MAATIAAAIASCIHCVIERLLAVCRGFVGKQGFQCKGTFCLDHFKQLRMYYRNCCIAARQTLCFHSSGGSTFLREMTSCNLVNVMSNRKSDSVNRCVRPICLRNNPAKCHPDQIWNDGALGFFESVARRRRRIITTRWVAIWDQFLIYKNVIIFKVRSDPWFKAGVTNYLNGPTRDPMYFVVSPLSFHRCRIAIAADPFRPSVVRCSPLR